MNSPTRRRDKPKADAARPKRSHKAAIPLPPIGTEERIILLRQRHTRRQETLKRKRDSLDELAFGRATSPIVDRNGRVIGRVQADERTTLADVDVETKPKVRLESPTVRPESRSPVPNLEKFSISYRIVLLRKRAGLSVWTSAKLAKVSRRQWGRWESGLVRPSIASTKSIANVLGVSVAVLIDDPV